jgi:hypothetical protein
MHVKGRTMFAAHARDIRMLTGADAPALGRRGGRDSRRAFGTYGAIIACALVWALIAPATSSAQHGRAAAPTSSLAGTTSPPSQDLRAAATTSSLAGTTSSDLRAAATTSSLAGTTSSDLRAAATTSSLAGTTSSDRRSPDVTVVKLAPVHSNSGIDWRAAGSALGVILLGLAAATAITHRRRRGPRTATAA